MWRTGLFRHPVHDWPKPTLEGSIVYEQGDNDEPECVTMAEVRMIGDDVVVDGKIAYDRFVPISRLGYRDYGRVTDVFEAVRPSD